MRKERSRLGTHLPKQPKGPERRATTDSGQPHGLAVAQRGAPCLCLCGTLLSCCASLWRWPP